MNVPSTSPAVLPALVAAIAACTASVAAPDGSGRDLPRKEAVVSELAPAGEGHRLDIPRAPDKARPPDLASPCKGVTCSGHGQCKVTGGQAACECEPYFKPGADKLSCIDACSGVSCNPGYACVPGAHDQTNPICVATCDCSNCGNCSMADFAASGAMQAYCGSSSYPPTVACNKPCPAGQGCIPYTPAICWPMEGCISK